MVAGVYFKWISLSRQAALAGVAFFLFFEHLKRLPDWRRKSYISSGSVDGLSRQAVLAGVAFFLFFEHLKRLPDWRRKSRMNAEADQSPLGSR